MSEWGVKGAGFDQIIKGLNNMGKIGERNLQAAIMDTALWSREELKQATKAPRKGELASVADLWRVDKEPHGASIVNPSEIAVYLEWGVGLYNEGPGHRGWIVPRMARNSFWANNYRTRTGKEPPKVLSWIDEDTGKRIFAKKVKGYKAVRMVRKNLPRITKAFGVALNTAATKTMRGEIYE